LFQIEIAIRQAYLLELKTVYGFCIAENLIEERSFITTVTDVVFFQVNFINGTVVSYLANQHNKLNKKTSSPPEKALRE
jgi:hypothetical protein